MFFLKPFLLFLLCSVIAGPGISAPGQIVPDSLLIKLNAAENDSVKTRTLLDIGEAIEETSTESSLAYYRQALTLALKINNPHLILSSYNDIGVAHIELNRLDSSIEIFGKALAVAKELEDTLRMARILVNIGNVHLHQGDRLTAIGIYLKAAALWESSSNKELLPGLYANINSLLTDQGEYVKAAEYGNKAVALAEKIGDDYSLVTALLNLSNTYSEINQKQKQFELLNKALPFAKKTGSLEFISTVYHDLGDFYYEMKDYHHSLDNYQQSFLVTQKMGNLYHLCSSYTCLADVYLKLGNDENALQNIILAENLATRVGARADLKHIYQTRGEIEEKAGNFQKAAHYYSMRIVLSDSLFKTETSEKVAEVEARYQNEKKQGQIGQLQKDKQIQALAIHQKSIINYFLIALVVMLIVIGLFSYRNRRNQRQLAKQLDELQKQRISELEKDKRLVAVDSMMKGEENERSRLAKDLHDGLGGLLSGVKFTLGNMKNNLIITPDNQAVFERSLDMLDTSIKELRRVAHNMMPEMLIKYGLDEAMKDYCQSIQATGLVSVQYQSVGMDVRLDSSMEIIIYRIVQELLNNVMKHASASEVFVQLVHEKNRISIIVEDNGKGFDTSILETNKAAGFASIRSRVDYLKGQLEINSESGKGTLVNIEIKT